MSNWEPLYATLQDVKFDVCQLKNHYIECIRTLAPKNYKEGDDGYDCLAITSRNGHIHDGISRKSIEENKDILGTSEKAVKPTEIFYGYVQELKHLLEEAGMDCYRMRYMRLKSRDYLMPFHRDRINEEGAWRLHIPIVTNPDCSFQWKSLDNKVFQVHFPADGKGHLVRVDIPHRALNNAPAGLFNDRVHLICDIYQPPSLDRLAIVIMGNTETSQNEKSKVDLLTASSSGRDMLIPCTPSTENIGLSSGRTTGSAHKDLTDDSISMNGNYKRRFPGFGFSKLALIVLALQQLKNGDLNPDQPISASNDINSVDYLNIRGNTKTISVMGVVNSIIHAQSTNSSLALAQYLFGDIDNYIANALELFIKADISSPECLHISSREMESNRISPWEALKFMDFIFCECPEFFDYAKAERYEYMGRWLKSSNRKFDSNSEKCVFKVKTKNLSHFNGVFLSEYEDGTPSKIRVDFRANHQAVNN